MIKYAMDGSANGEPETHGTLYPWKRNQISDVDPFMGRVAVVPTVDTTDTVYGFYSYFEPDVVYTALDVNPVTNPSIKNTVICFYYRATSNPLQEIYHQVFNDSGPIAGMTNDPKPSDLERTDPVEWDCLRRDGGGCLLRHRNL